MTPSGTSSRATASPAAPPSAISVRDLWFDYGGTPILSGVSFELAPGTFAGLVGPNGGGKSTLLKLMLGLLKPKKGEIRLHGLPPQKAGQIVGYVPQFASFRRDFPITALECVALGGVRGLFPTREEKREAARRASELLEQFELGRFAERQIAALSGGQLQRVLIARALMSAPPILLMDEPTANVDARSEHALFEMLRELTAFTTILLVSHDIGFISNHVSEVFCLNKSLVCHDTSPAGESIDALYGAAMQMIHHDTAHSHRKHREEGR